MSFPELKKIVFQSAWIESEITKKIEADLAEA